MDDLTVIMMTANKVPRKWAKFHKHMICSHARGAHFITVSFQPLNWGVNLIQEEYGLANIYYQMLRAAKIATTPYIAMAEDDTIYPREHFKFRPKENAFYYNLNRWHMFAWGKPQYFHKPMPGNGLLVCDRQLLIDGLEVRFSRYPQGLPHKLAHEMGVGPLARVFDKVGWLGFETRFPVVSFYHDGSVDPNIRNKSKRRMATSYELPFWGEAEKVREYFQ